MCYFLEKCKIAYIAKLSITLSDSFSLILALYNWDEVADESRVNMKFRPRVIVECNHGRFSIVGLQN